MIRLFAFGDVDQTSTKYKIHKDLSLLLLAHHYYYLVLSGTIALLLIIITVLIIYKTKIIYIEREIHR